jgi:hypothetical protein
MMESKILKFVGIILSISGIIILAKPEGWLRYQDKLITRWKITPLKLLGIIFSIVGVLILACF